MQWSEDVAAMGSAGRVLKGRVQGHASSEAASDGAASVPCAAPRPGHSKSHREGPHTTYRRNANNPCIKFLCEFLALEVLHWVKSRFAGNGSATTRSASATRLPLTSEHERKICVQWVARGVRPSVRLRGARQSCLVAELRRGMLSLQPV